MEFWIQHIWFWRQNNIFWRMVFGLWYLDMEFVTRGQIESGLDILSLSRPLACEKHARCLYVEVKMIDVIANSIKFEKRSISHFSSNTKLHLISSHTYTTVQVQGIRYFLKVMVTTSIQYVLHVNGLQSRSIQIQSIYRENNVGEQTPMTTEETGYESSPANQSAGLQYW